MSAPSGHQYEISHGEQSAVIVEVGGGLRSYAVAGGDRLDGYGPGDRCSGGRGQPLIPWPNRVRDGRYRFDGAEHQLALTEPEAGNAIHGLVRWANWWPREQAPDRIVMANRLHPQPGWPGTLDLRIEYALGPGGLTVTTEAINVGAVACPYGGGFHPYLTLGTATIDALHLQAPGRLALVADKRGIPTGTRPVADTPYDFTQPRPIGDLALDIGFTDLARDADGLARVHLGTADGQRGSTLWCDDTYGYLMIFTGDTLSPEQRRRGLAVEPMTCAPNALNSGDGLLRLEPGQRHRSQWGLHLL